MANADTPRGLSPVRYQGGACYSGAANMYYFASGDGTAAYVGGLVKLAGSADADGVASVTANITTGDAVIGVIVAIDPSNGAGANGRDSKLYRVASTERYVYVADDPNLIFSVQDDASATLTADSVGNVADLTGLTSGSTTTGLSSIEISATTATASSDDTENVLIVGLERKPDNSIGDNANWLVRLNNHAYIDGNTGV
jgi:hypothetical protein